MIEVLSTPHNRILTIVFLAIGCASATSAVVVGISDNPPGILLAFGAAAAFVIAFVHPWRTVKQFRRLLYVALLGLVIFAILHTLFEAIAAKFTGAGVFQNILQGIGVATFLIAVLICPPAIVVGAIGMLVMFIRNRRRPI